MKVVRRKIRSALFRPPLFVLGDGDLMSRMSRQIDTQVRVQVYLLIKGNLKQDPLKSTIQIYDEKYLR